MASLDELVNYFVHLSLVARQIPSPAVFLLHLVTRVCCAAVKESGQLVLGCCLLHLHAPLVRLYEFSEIDISLPLHCKYYST